MKRLFTLLVLLFSVVSPAAAQQLGDRGTGIPTSMFGTYIGRGELILYPFYEHYHADYYEYKPEEFGVVGSEDLKGRFRAHETLLFVGYGVSDRLAVEFEAAAIQATLDKSPADGSALPSRITESGLGDIEGQVRWRWNKESATRPEWFSYGEAVIPHYRDRPLTGTADWELKFGTGLIRGFKWGTLTARGALEYAKASSSPWDFGEYAIEYLKRLSPKWRVHVSLEGVQDELELISDLQWHVSPRAFIRLNNGFGLTPKATDWAPELGVVFTLP